jgi:hypothetical protein
VLHLVFEKELVRRLLDRLSALCARFFLDGLAVALLQALPAAVRASGEETCEMVAHAMKKPRACGTKSSFSATGVDGRRTGLKHREARRPGRSRTTTGVSFGLGTRAGCAPCHGSAVGLTPIADARDFYGIAEVAENDVVVPGAEAVERGGHALETLDVAFLGLGEAGESLEDLDGGLSIDGAEPSASLNRGGARTASPTPRSIRDFAAPPPPGWDSRGCYHIV